MFGSGCLSDLALCKTTLIISNKEMNDVMKITIISLLKKSIDESCLLIKGISKATRNELKEQICY